MQRHPRSSYIADVLERCEAEGRQIICQGFSNTSCVPALEERKQSATCNPRRYAVTEYRELMAFQKSSMVRADLGA